MHLDDLFFARFADLTPDGLFTVVGGGLHRINARAFPWSWDLLFLLARVRFTTEEAQGQHTAAIERETPDGQIEPIGGGGPLGPVPPTVEIGPDGRVGVHLTFR